MSEVHRGVDFSNMSAPDDKPGLTFEQNLEHNAMLEALKRCCEVIENDVRQLRREGFEGASWQLDAIRKARRFVETTDPLPDIGVTLEGR